MKGGKTPIHIQRWAPADYHQDEHVQILEKRRDYRTLTFYRHFLDFAFMAGGDLPADPEALAAIVKMPQRDIEVALRFCVGRLIFRAGDRLYQRRVRREVKKELQLRKIQAKLGYEGGKKAGRGRPLNKDRGTPMESIGPPSPTPTPTPSPTNQRGKPANPNVDRDALVREGHRLIGEIALAENLDPTEVISKASRWNGRSYVRLDTMPDDRLAHTVNALRSWRRRQTGEPEPAPPPQHAERAPPTDKARARQESAEALIRGGLIGDHGRGMGDRDGGPGGVLLERGADAGDGDAPRPALPAGPRVPER